MKTTILLTVAIQHSSEEFLEKAISAFAHGTTLLGKKKMLLDLFQIILRQSWLLRGRLDSLKEKKTILESLINSRVLGLDECVKRSVSCLHVQEACWILPLGRVMPGHIYTKLVCREAFLISPTATYCTMCPNHEFREVAEQQRNSNHMFKV